MNCTGLWVQTLHRNTGKYLHHDDSKPGAAEDHRPCCKTSGTIQEMVDAALGAEYYCTDGYSGYLDVVFPRKYIYNIHNKNDTFTPWRVSMLICAIYIPALARLSRYFPRKLKNLQVVLAVFVRAYNHFRIQKDYYRSRHPGTPVPFSIFNSL